MVALEGVDLAEEVEGVDLAEEVGGVVLAEVEEVDLAEETNLGDSAVEITPAVSEAAAEDSEVGRNRNVAEVVKKPLRRIQY